jgi:hypothetical protein
MIYPQYTQWMKTSKTGKNFLCANGKTCTFNDRSANRKLLECVGVGIGKINTSDKAKLSGC